MTKKFIILSTQRSGSTVLLRTLDAHPEIFCAGEIFNEKKEIFHPQWYFKPTGFKSNRPVMKKINKILNYPNLKLNFQKHLDKFYAANEKNEKARGFKLMFSQLNENPAILNYLRRNEIKIIVLIRKNIFKNALSRFRMSETGFAHSYKEKKDEKKIHISPSEFLQWMHKIENTNHKILEVSKEFSRLIIYYEEFENWSSTVKKIFDFLSVSPVEIKPVLEKISKQNWHDEVENYIEIEKILSENNYSDFLN